MRQAWLNHGVIVLIAGLSLFTNLGGPRLWDRDEPRNAGCAREMQQRADWIVPVFNAELRAHKPVLLYWLIMSAYALFGVNEFAARFWSAALGMGTALATYHMGRRLFSPQVGLWSAVILSTSLMFDVAGRAATPDSALVFFSTLTLLVYVRSLGGSTGSGVFLGQTRHIVAGALAQEDSRPLPGVPPVSRPTAVLMYGLMGLGVLTKGPVGVVLPTAVIGMFLLIVQLPSDARAATCSTWIGRWLNWLRPFAPAHFLRVCWQMRPLTALLVVAAVAAPWYLWVGLRTHGEFLRIFLLEHNLGRAAQVMEGHQGSVFFYPLAMLVGFFPWSVFLVPTLLALISGWRRYDERRPGYLLACCWIGVYVVLFSCARTKLPSYVTPCYPALALLTGCFLEDWTKERVMLWRLWPRLAFGALGLIGAILIAVLPPAARRFLPGEEGLGLIGAIPLAGAIVGWLLLRSERRQAAAMSFTAMAALFTVTLCGFVAQRIDRHQHNHRLLAAIDRHGRNPRIGAFGCLEPTWIFYGRRPVQELAVGQSASSALPAAGEFFGDGEDRFIITTDRQWPTLRERLPTTAAVLAECPFLFRSERLLLVGRARPLPSVAARPDKDVGGNRR